MNEGQGGGMPAELVDALRGCCTRRAGDGEHLLVAELGTVDYDAALALQDELCEGRRRGETADALLLLEHPPIYTLGRGAAAGSGAEGAGGPVPWRRVGRGGQATFHGPGQLVGYPIIDLSQRPPGVKRDATSYVRALEQAVIRAIAPFGLTGVSVDARPGVWVAGRKLASVGVGIRRWVTSHGFALNVTTDLSYFEGIVPCGLAGVRMTSLLREGVRAGSWAVGERVAGALAAVLGYSDVAWVYRDGKRT